MGLRTALLPRVSAGPAHPVGLAQDASRKETRLLVGSHRGTEAHS